MESTNETYTNMDDRQNSRHCYHDNHRSHFDTMTIMPPTSPSSSNNPGAGASTLYESNDNTHSNIKSHRNLNDLTTENEENVVVDHSSNDKNEGRVNHANDNEEVDIDEEQEQDQTQGEDGMTIEERQIHESLMRDREEAHAKLQTTLDRVRETTKTMLNEIGSFLESTESVMIDYTKCQNSQRNEARRLEEVEPDVVGATQIYLEQVKGMMG